MWHDRSSVNEKRLACLACLGCLLNRKVRKKLCLVYAGHCLGAVVGGSDTVLGEVDIMYCCIVEVVLDIPSKQMN